MNNVRHDEENWVEPGCGPRFQPKKTLLNVLQVRETVTNEDKSPIQLHENRYKFGKTR